MLKRLTEMLSRGQNDRITKHTSNLVTGVEKSDGTSMNFKAKKSVAGFFVEKQVRIMGSSGRRRKMSDGSLCRICRTRYGFEWCK